jgi:hypothetical protein
MTRIRELWRQRGAIGPPARSTFEDTSIGTLEEESDLQEARQAREGPGAKVVNGDLQIINQDGVLVEDTTSQA